MSHFAVLVIGPDHEAQLAPYHEYECTGVDDEYVVDVDVTEKVHAALAETQKALKFPDGRLVSRFASKFYTGAADPSEPKLFQQPTFVMPPNAVEIEVTRRELMVADGQTVAEFAKEYGGWFERDGTFWDHTNPNARWDWYVVGGRWTGHFKLKEKAHGIVGRPGLMTDPAAPGYADQAMKGDIDFEQMRNDAEVKARHLWKETRLLTAGATWESWDDTLIRYPGNIETARTEYWAQPAVELLKAADKPAYRFKIDDDLALDEAIYIERQRANACSLFAFVRDSKWTERGKMGWFASVSDDISQAQWTRMFNDMLDALPADTLLTVVDCHI